MMGRRRSPGRRRVDVLVGLVCALTLAGCGSDGRDPSSAAPLDVTVGEEFTWNDFTVEDGWELKGVERSVNMEPITTPEISGTIVNNSEEERFAIFQVTFSADGDAVATVNCTAAKMVEGQAMPFLCPGLNTSMPETYDAVTVMQIRRDTGESRDDESGT